MRIWARPRLTSNVTSVKILNVKHLAFASEMEVAIPAIGRLHLTAIGMLSATDRVKADVCAGGVGERWPSPGF